MILAALALALSAAAAEPRRSFEEIERSLDYGLWNNRIQALYDVGELGGDGLNELRYASDDADWQVRLTVVHFMGKIGPAAAPALARLARAEPCPAVRLSALRFLEGMGPAAAGELRAVMTEEDRRNLATIPDRYGTQRMGKPLVIDAPDGMTKEFFEGGVDLRVCASSEHSGRRHGGPGPSREEVWHGSDDPEVRTPPVPARPKAVATKSGPRGIPETLPPDLGAGRRARAAEGAAEYERVERVAAAAGTVRPVSGEVEALPPGPAAPERAPSSVASVAAEATSRDDLRPSAVKPAAGGAAESLPPGPAAPPGRAKNAPTADIVPDAGTGRPEYDAIPALIAQLSGAEPRRRARAADELGKRGESARVALTALRKALGDADRRVRASAVLALGGVGPAAEVGGDIRRALRDKDEDVRFSAEMALQRLGRAP